MKIPIPDNILDQKIKDIPHNKKVKCEVKYDRFKNKLEDIQLLE